MERQNASVAMRMAAENEGYSLTDIEWNEHVSNADLDQYNALPMAEGSFYHLPPFKNPFVNGGNFSFVNGGNFSGEEE